jgi:hypothetical protein
MIRGKSIEHESEKVSRFTGVDRLVNPPGSTIAAVY